MRLSLTLGHALLLSGCAATPPASDLSPRVAAAQDWAVFAEETAEGRLCWVASPPVSSSVVGEHDGSRPGVFLMTLVKPDSGPEVSYVGGWPLARDSVNLAVGASSYDFFGEGPIAWIDDDLLQPDLVSDLRSGSEAVARGVSLDGRVVVDRFSLYGYSAALEEAERRCA